MELRHWSPRRSHIRLIPTHCLGINHSRKVFLNGTIYKIVDYLQKLFKGLFVVAEPDSLKLLNLFRRLKCENLFLFILLFGCSEQISVKVYCFFRRTELDGQFFKVDIYHLCLPRFFRLVEEIPRDCLELLLGQWYYLSTVFKDITSYRHAF